MVTKIKIYYNISIDKKIIDNLCMFVFRILIAFILIEKHIPTLNIKIRPYV